MANNGPKLATCNGSCMITTCGLLVFAKLHLNYSTEYFTSKQNSCVYLLSQLPNKVTINMEQGLFQLQIFGDNFSITIVSITTRIESRYLHMINYFSICFIHSSLSNPGLGRYRHSIHYQTPGDNFRFQNWIKPIWKHISMLSLVKVGTDGINGLESVCHKFNYASER